MGAHMVAAAAVLVTMAMLFHGGAAVYNVPKGKWALPMDNNNISNWVKINAPIRNYSIYFEYANKTYDVAKVNRANYVNCKVGNSDTLHLRRTGGDEFKLDVGSNYFICTLRDYCHRGMRLNITAIAA